MQVGEAFITVRPDTSKFGSELTRSTETAGRQASSGLGQAIAGGAAVAGFARITSAASDLQQAVGGTEAVFGEAGAAIDEFAANSADAVGLSEASYRQLASFAGNQLKGLGFSAADAAEQTNVLITMGADLAATFGGTTEEAVSALSATFRGEYDPVERYVAGLRASTVAAKAVEMGLAESGGAISNYARGQATLALLTEGSADAQGQFAREADTAAGAQARAAAAAENAAASTGSNFLPIYQQGVAVVNSFATAFGALPGPLQSATVLLAGAVALKGPLVSGFGAISGALSGMTSRFTAAGGGARGLASLITPGALGVGAAVVGIGLLTQGLADNARRAQEAEDRMKALSDAFTEGGAAAAGDTLLTQITDQVPEAVDALNEAGVSTVDLVNAAAEGGGALEEMVRHVGDVGNLSSLSTIELGRLAEATLAASAASESTGAANEANAESAATAASAFDDEATAMGEVADAASAAKDQLDQLFGIQRSLAEGQIAIRDGARELLAALVEMGEGGFRAGTESGDAFMTMLQDQAGVIEDQVIAYAAAGHSIQETRAFQRGLQGDVLQVARAAGVGEEAIGRYSRNFLTIPRQALTDLVADGRPARTEIERTTGHTRRWWDNRRFLAHLDADERDAVNAYNNAIRLGNDWEGRVYEAHFNARMAGGIPGQATETATGGHRAGGEVLLVGERGPEIWVPDSAGTMIPNHQLSGNGGTPIGGDAGGVNVTVVVEGNVIGDVDRFADEIAFRAAEKISRGAI